MIDYIELNEYMSKRSDISLFHEEFNDMKPNSSQKEFYNFCQGHPWRGVLYDECGRREGKTTALYTILAHHLRYNNRQNVLFIRNNINSVRNELQLLKFWKMVNLSYNVYESNNILVFPMPLHYVYFSTPNLDHLRGSRFDLALIDDYLDIPHFDELQQSLKVCCKNIIGVSSKKEVTVGN